MVTDLGDIDAKEISSFPIRGTDIVLRVGRYGPYLEGPDDALHPLLDLGPARKAEDPFPVEIQDEAVPAVFDDPHIAYVERGEPGTQEIDCLHLSGA